MAKPVVPLGEPADWSRDDVDRMSRVSDADKVESRDYWRDRAPRTLPQGDGTTVDAKALIDAKPRKRKAGT